MGKLASNHCGYFIRLLNYFGLVLLWRSQYRALVWPQSHYRISSIIFLSGLYRLHLRANHSLDVFRCDEWLNGAAQPNWNFAVIRAGLPRNQALFTARSAAKSR